MPYTNYIQSLVKIGWGYTVKSVHKVVTAKAIISPILTLTLPDDLKNIMATRHCHNTNWIPQLVKIDQGMFSVECSQECSYMWYVWKNQGTIAH